MHDLLYSILQIYPCTVVIVVHRWWRGGLTFIQEVASASQPYTAGYIGKTTLKRISWSNLKHALCQVLSSTLLKGYRAYWLSKKIGFMQTTLMWTYTYYVQMVLVYCCGRIHTICKRCWSVWCGCIHTICKRCLSTLASSCFCHTDF